MEWPLKGYFTELHHSQSQTVNMVKGNEVLNVSERKRRTNKRDSKWTDGLTERGNTTTESG